MPALLYDQPCLPYPHHFPLSRNLEPNAPPFPGSPPLIDLSLIPLSSPMSNLDGLYSPSGTRYPPSPHDSLCDDTSPHSKLGSECQPGPRNGSSSFCGNGDGSFSVAARTDIASPCRQCSSPMMHHSNRGISIDELSMKQLPPNFWSEGEVNDTFKSHAKLAALQNQVSVDSLTALQNLMLLNGYDDQVAHSWLAMDHLGDEFRMYDFKVKKCMRGRSHDWTECPFAHPGEKARRRDPRRVQYCGSPCPDFRKGSCKKGDNCEFAHGVFECWLHPARYRTQPCRDGVNCKRRVCFFAHTRDQLRHLPDSNCDFPDDSRSTAISSPSQANTMRKSASAVKSSMHRAMLENLLSFQQQNDTFSWESPQFFREGADLSGPCHSPYYPDALPSSGLLGMKGKCNYDMDEIGYSSPTSTLQHFRSPPFSPLASPCSGTLEKVRKISSNSTQNVPDTFLEGSSYAVSLDNLSTSFQGVQLSAFQQSPSSNHVFPGVQQADQGRLHESGKGSLLRAKSFNEVHRDSIEQQVPDLDWVSELVK